MNSLRIFWQNRIGEFRERTRKDIFAMAHAKILISYVIIGLLVTLVSGYLVYRNTIYFAQDIIVAVQEILKNHATANEASISNSVIQIINTEIWRINFFIGLLMLAILGIYAYILARVTLWPIQKAMDRQRRFASNIAHELRTPLAVMKTNFEVTMLSADTNTKEDFKNAIQTGIEEVDRMSAIAHFLLNFSSVDGPRVEDDFMEIDLSAIIQKTFEALKLLIAQREVNVEVACPEPVWIHGNKTALNEMLINLIKNALAYTPVNGSVLISAQYQHGSPTLSVSDTGIGIPAADLPHIFEPFFRGENAYSQRSKKRGTGLGLAIVQEIIKLHKGHISVKSELGQGTTISIRFPGILPKIDKR